MPRLITLIVMVLFGGLFSQAPEFQQQYRQRLGGELDALTREVARFGEDAQAAGVSIEAALARLKANADDLARGRGAAMADVMVRRDRLERQRQAFDADSVIGRLTSLAVDFDPPLAMGTWRSFRPAIPSTLDGAAATVFGAGIGLFIFALASLAIRMLRSALTPRVA